MATNRFTTPHTILLLAIIIIIIIILNVAFPHHHHHLHYLLFHVHSTKHKPLQPVTGLPLSSCCHYRPVVCHPLPTHCRSCLAVVATCLDGGVPSYSTTHEPPKLVTGPPPSSYCHRRPAAAHALLLLLLASAEEC